MDIKKMAEKIRIEDLDFDAAEEADNYIEEFIELFKEMIGKRKAKFGSKDFTTEAENLMREAFAKRFVVRNTNVRGQVSPTTGEPKKFLNPSPKLGYATEKEADDAVKRNNKRAGMARAKAARRIKEIENEITEEVVEETVEELIQQNSKLSELMDELNITFGGELGPTGGSLRDRGLKLDEKLDRILEALDEDDVQSYTQDELVKLTQFIAKLHKNPDRISFTSMQPYVRANHKKRLKEYFQMAARKVKLEKMWKSVVKRRKAIDLIDDFLGMLNGDTFEKGASNKVKRAIKRAVDNTEDYQYLNYDPNKGGKHPFIEFTEKDPKDRHEGKEPHKLSIPGTPLNLQNYTKRIPKKLREKVYEDVTGNYSKEKPLNWKDYLKPRK